MKKLHLTTGKDQFRLAQQYIQVKDVCDCLGAESYKFEFRGTNKIIMIKAKDSDAIAGIMPMQTEW
jgi:hypothetical protein